MDTATPTPYLSPDGLYKKVGMPSKSVAVKGSSTSDDSLMANINQLFGSLVHGNNIIQIFNPMDPAGIPFTANNDSADSSHQSKKIYSPRSLPPALNVYEKPVPEFDVGEGAVQPKAYIRQCLDSITAKSAEVQAVYDGLLPQNNSVAKTLPFTGHIHLKMIARDINDQKVRFAVTNESLLRALSDTTLEEAMHNFVVYEQVLNMLDSILRVLRDTPVHFDRIYNSMKVRRPLDPMCKSISIPSSG